MKLSVVLEPSDEGGFTATVPSLPGCISEGGDRDEALRNIQEAIQLYLEPVDDDLGFPSAPRWSKSLYEQSAQPCPTNA